MSILTRRVTYIILQMHRSLYRLPKVYVLERWLFSKWSTAVLWWLSFSFLLLIMAQHLLSWILQIGFRYQDDISYCYTLNVQWRVFIFRQWRQWSTMIQASSKPSHGLTSQASRTTNPTRFVPQGTLSRRRRRNNKLTYLFLLVLNDPPRLPVFYALKVTKFRVKSNHQR